MFYQTIIQAIGPLDGTIVILGALGSFLGFVLNLFMVWHKVSAGLRAEGPKQLPILFMSAQHAGTSKIVTIMNEPKLLPRSDRS